MEWVVRWGVLEEVEFCQDFRWALAHVWSRCLRLDLGSQRRRLLVPLLVKNSVLIFDDLSIPRLPLISRVQAQTGWTKSSSNSRFQARRRFHDVSCDMWKSISVVDSQHVVLPTVLAWWSPLFSPTIPYYSNLNTVAEDLGNHDSNPSASFEHLPSERAVCPHQVVGHGKSRIHLPLRLCCSHMALHTTYPELLSLTLES